MRAVVTGGGSGIGAALCRVLAARGATVVVADLDEGSARRTVDGIAAGANKTVAQPTREAGHAAVRCDVTNADEVEKLAARAGEVDLWINNAGIAIGGAAHELSLDDWKRVLDVNLTGVIHGIHAVYPRMIACGRGHIVNIASVAGLAPYPLALPYTTSKHAVVGMSLALRAEARAHGIRVSVACPGMIKTPIWERSEVRGALANGRSKLLARVAGMMSADDCATAIVRGIDADRGVIPVTAEAHIAWRLARMSPALATAVSSRVAMIARRLGPGDPRT